MRGNNQREKNNTTNVLTHVNVSQYLGCMTSGIHNGEAGTTQEKPDVFSVTSILTKQIPTGNEPEVDSQPRANL